MDASRERLQRLLEPVHDRAVAFARSVCRSTADGDDLFQEALLRAIEKIDALREDGAFRVWLYPRDRLAASQPVPARVLAPAVAADGRLEADAPSAEETLGAASAPASRSPSSRTTSARRSSSTRSRSGRSRRSPSSSMSRCPRSSRASLAVARRLRTIYARRFGVALDPTPALIPGETR